MLPTIDWQGDTIVMVDQRKLPVQELYVKCTSAPEVARAIRTMVIRGAPAIGVATAMGIALGIANGLREPSDGALVSQVAPRRSLREQQVVPDGPGEHLRTGLVDADPRRDVARGRDADD